MGKSTREQAQKTKESITNAAKILFSQNGYDKTNISTVADYTGLTRGAVYWHFQNKDELLIELWNKMIKKDSSFYLSISDISNINGSALDYMENWLLNIVDFLIKKDNQSIMKLILSIKYGKQGTTKIRNTMNDLHESVIKNVKILITRAINQGELPKNANPELIANFICATIDGYMFYYIDGINSDIVDNNSIVIHNVINSVRNFSCSN